MNRDWRYIDDVQTSEDELRAQETTVDDTLLRLSWLRLQILHTPFRAIEQDEYSTLTESLQGLERLFLERPTLESYYRECFAPETEWQMPIIGPDGRPQALPESSEIDHVAAIQAQFMEDVFYALRLDRYGNAPDNRGWMNLFRRWGRSPTFNRRLDQLRSMFGLDFLEFYDLYLRYYQHRIDELPIPHPWDSDQDREDRRPPLLAPPAKTGGVPHPSATVGPSAPPADQSLQQPEKNLVPGIFLDPGIREVKRRGPASGERPVESPSKSSPGTPLVTEE